MDIFQIIVLGLVQAVTEWLPLSSKTIDTIVYTDFFGGKSAGVISVLLFLHIGTMLAAAIYFRKELLALAKHFLRAPSNIPWQSNSQVGFIFTAILFTGIVGMPLLLLEKFVIPTLDASALLCVMGAGLILTGFLLSSQGKQRWRASEFATWKDGILTGALQGLASLPGVSRAGTSTTGLIWRGFDSESAFHLSFLLSIPTVFLTEAVFWLAQGGVSSIPLADGLALAVSSFVFGYITIGFLLRLVKKLNVSWLAFLFGIMMLAFGLLGVG